jgi:hypothetical protein
MHLVALPLSRARWYPAWEDRHRGDGPGLPAISPGYYRRALVALTPAKPFSMFARG